MSQTKGAAWRGPPHQIRDQGGQNPGKSFVSMDTWAKLCHEVGVSDSDVTSISGDFAIFLQTTARHCPTGVYECGEGTDRPTTSPEDAIFNEGTLLTASIQQFTAHAVKSTHAAIIQQLERMKNRHHKGNRRKKAIQIPEAEQRKRK